VDAPTLPLLGGFHVARESAQVVEERMRRDVLGELLPDLR
jgi:hypothetical protein